MYLPDGICRPYVARSAARFAALDRSAALADARHHLASVSQSPHAVEYLRTVLRLCRESSRGSALEIETGSGLASIWLSLRGVRAAGEDLSPQAVERGRAVNNAVDGTAVFRVGDPFAGARKGGKPVAVIHHAGLLEHFTVPWVRALLARQAARAEHVVFTVPSVYYPYEPEFGDERLLPLEEWQRILEPFDVVDLRYAGGPADDGHGHILAVVRAGAWDPAADPEEGFAPGISVIVHTRNEEARLRDCLESLKDWADEIIVCDMESTDRTLEIAAEYTENIVKHPYIPNFDRARNVSAMRAARRFILYVDADERVPPKLAAHLREMVEKDPAEFEAAMIPFRHHFAGRWMRCLDPGYTSPRLFRNGSFYFHARPHTGAQVNGRLTRVPAGDPDLAITHLSYDSLSHYLTKLNGYTDSEAANMHRDGAPFHWTRAVAHFVQDMQAYYGMGAAAKDGVHGFIYAFLSGFYRFEQHAKLYELRARSGQLQAGELDSIGAHTRNEDARRTEPSNELLGYGVMSVRTRSARGHLRARWVTGREGRVRRRPPGRSCDMMGVGDRTVVRCKPMVAGRSRHRLRRAAGRLVATMDPLGRIVTSTLDPTGAVTVRTDARNWPTTYTQDLLGRTVGVEYLDGTLVTNTFDADGRQTAIADSTGIVTTTFDAAGQPRTVNNWVGRPLTYTLDAVGNRTRLDDCDGRYWTYTWDPDNRLGRVYSNYGQSTTLTNDPLGRETQRVLANGVRIDRTYDPAGRETVLSARKADGTLNALYSATYDPMGSRLHVDELDGSTVDYGYDATYRLTSEERVGAHGFNVTMAFDAAGNRATKQDSTGTTAYDYNAANELTLVTPPTGAPTSFTQDANGNVVVEATGADETTYTWDSENRLVHIELPDATEETNAYRADGLRHSHEDTDGLVYFLWDEQNVLHERTSTASGRAVYTQLPGIWGGEFSYKRGANHIFLLPDFQGHTRQIANITGDVVTAYIYDAWGREVWPIVTTGNYLRPFGQHGYWRDTPNRLYVRARQLRVDLGRWMSRDPLGFAGGDWNVYGYVGGRPVGAVDPNGLYGAAVHLRCTAHTARQTYLGSWPVYVGFRDPDAIARYDMATDTELAFNPAQHWSYHFNWHGDWNSTLDDRFMCAGQAVPGAYDPGADTRWLFYKSMYAQAQELARARRDQDCDTVMHLFGHGLHAVQDIFSHLDLSPAEHQDEANYWGVDEIDYDRSTAQPLVRTMRPMPAGWVFSRRCRTGAQLHYPLCRAWRWDRGGYRYRWVEDKTRALLAGFLAMLVAAGSPCVACLPAVEPRVTPCPF